MAGNAELAAGLDQMRRRYDAEFKIVVYAIRRLLAPPEKPRPGSASSPDPRRWSENTLLCGDLRPASAPDELGDVGISGRGSVPTTRHDDRQLPRAH